MLRTDYWMNRLVSVMKEEDIFPQYRDTPIGLLLRYHNLEKPYDNHVKAQLLIGMCMDHRNVLKFPDNFAFVLRAGGANLRYSEFKVSYAIGVGGVNHIVLIGHTNCGMVNLFSKKDRFVDGLAENAGWEKEKAEEHFLQNAPMFEIGNEVQFTISETNRLRSRYPKVTVAPLMFSVENNKLFLIKEG